VTANLRLRNTLSKVIRCSVNQARLSIKYLNSICVHSAELTVVTVSMFTLHLYIKQVRDCIYVCHGEYGPDLESIYGLGLRIRITSII